MDDVLAPALAHVDRREDQDDRGHRDVHPEDPLPAEVLGEDAAHENACCGAATSDCAPCSECLVPLAALGEGHGDDGERGRCDDRRPEALDAARRDQHPRGRREPADERGGAEDPEPDHEHDAAPDQVGRAPAEQEEAAVREPVRGDHPLQVPLREVQIVLDRRQRDIDDRDVEHHDEDRGADQDQRFPAARIRRGCVHASSTIHSRT